MRTRIFIAAALACAVVLTGCGRRSGEPTRDDLEGAMRAFLKDRNARGGLRLALAARPERTLQFDIELHSLIKRSCTGKDTVWTCNVNLTMSYPPIDTRDSFDSELVVFNGPGGWRVIK